MGRPARILVPVALVATLTAASAGKGLASGDLWWSFLNLLLNIAAAAYVGVAILHRDVRRAAFPILMAALLAAMILRLPQLQELYFGLVDDCAQWLAGTKDRSFLGGPLLGLGALALAGLVLGVLARLMLRVRGTDQAAKPWQPRWTLAAALTLLYPWIAAILPLAAAAIVIGGYDSHHGATYTDAASRKLALTTSQGLMVAAGVGCGAVLAAMVALDHWVMHGRRRSRALPTRLRPFQALHNTVRGWLLGFTVLFWGILLAIGVRATWPAGAWAVVALYAGLAALSGGVYVWWASPRGPRWWEVGAVGGWVGLLAVYFALLLSGWRIPERGAAWLTFGYTGAWLLALAWRARRGDAGRA